MVARKGDACSLLVSHTATRFSMRVSRWSPGAVPPDAVGHPEVLLNRR
jgi:hypothetical protein